MKISLPHRGMALTVILTVQLMLAMDFLIVVVSLKDIQSDLKFTSSGLSWIPNAFGLAFGGLLLFGGRLGDLIGQLKAFRIGIAIFVLASFAGGISATSLILITARVFQGIGAAVAAPSVLALITILAQNEEEKNRGLSLFIAVSSIGASLGLILGGTLTEYISWRWSLLINVPIGAVAFSIITLLVPETEKVKGKLDVFGALTGALGSTALVFGFISAGENGWTSAITVLSFAGALILCTLFAKIESRVAEPLINPNLLKSRKRRGSLMVKALIVGMHFAMLFLILQYFAQILEYNPLLAGCAYLPLTAVVFTISNFVPALIHRFGTRSILISGCILVAISLVGFSALNSESSYMVDVLPPLLLHSIGIALVFVPGSIVVLEDVEDQNAGVMSGVLQISEQLGGAVGIAVITSVYIINSNSDDFSIGFRPAFLTAFGFSLLAAVIAFLTLPKK